MGHHPKRKTESAMTCETCKKIGVIHDSGYCPNVAWAEGNIPDDFHDDAEAVVGMPATIRMHTDRHAATVIAVTRFKSGARAGQVRAVTVQEDTATRTDSNGMSEAQDYAYAPNPDGAVTTFRLDKYGVFRAPGRALTLGVRDAYHDFSY